MKLDLPFTIYDLRRSVEREWLDDLPGDDSRAVRSRRDLRFINRIMGHAGMIRRALRGVPTPPRIAELGAGDGTLMLRAIAGVSNWRGAQIVLVDRQPVVSAKTTARYAEQDCRICVEAADVFEWLSQQTSTYDAIVANLFLHHFDPPGLTRMFTLASQHTKIFVACEPRRARLALAGSHMLGFLGCNDVTRHDAVLSVRAGFSGKELSPLWPAREDWIIEERRAGLFSHLFVAHAVNRES